MSKTTKTFKPTKVHTALASALGKMASASIKAQGTLKSDVIANTGTQAKREAFCAAMFVHSQTKYQRNRKLVTQLSDKKKVDGTSYSKKERAARATLQLAIVNDESLNGSIAAKIKTTLWSVKADGSEGERWSITTKGVPIDADGNLLAPPRLEKAKARPDSGSTVDFPVVPKLGVEYTRESANAVLDAMLSDLPIALLDKLLDNKAKELREHVTIAHNKAVKRANADDANKANSTKARAA